MSTNFTTGEKFLFLPKIYDPDLPFKQRITLAAILYRNRIHRGASLRWLSEITGFDRQTIKRHVLSLADLGYAHEKNKTWFLVSPESEELIGKYRWKKYESDKGTFANIQTIKITLPLTNHLLAVVLYAVLSVSKPEQSIRGLARLLGSSRNSIAAAIADLVNVEAITACQLFATSKNGKPIPHKIQFSILKRAPARPGAKHVEVEAKPVIEIDFKTNAWLEHRFSLSHSLAYELCVVEKQLKIDLIRAINWYTSEPENEELQTLGYTFPRSQSDTAKLIKLIKLAAQRFAEHGDRGL